MSKTDHLYLKPTTGVAWGAPKTIRELMAQLDTMDPDLTVHGVFFTTIGGKTVARTKHLSMSFERIDRPHIKQGDESVPWAVAFWTSEDQRPSPPSAKEG